MNKALPNKWLHLSMYSKLLRLKAFAEGGVFCNTDCRCRCRHSQINGCTPSVFETPPPYQNDILSEGCVF